MDTFGLIQGIANLVLTSVAFEIAIVIYYITKQATIMRRSTVLSLPPSVNVLLP